MARDSTSGRSGIEREVSKESGALGPRRFGEEESLHHSKQRHQLLLPCAEFLLMGGAGGHSRRGYRPHVTVPVCWLSSGNLYTWPDPALILTLGTMSQSTGCPVPGESRRGLACGGGPVCHVPNVCMCVHVCAGMPRGGCMFVFIDRYSAQEMLLRAHGC